MKQVTTWPVEFDGIDKGSVFSTAQLEEILAIERTAPEWPFACLQLKARIEQELGERGKPATVVIRSQELIVLTDPEASTYNHSRVRSYLGRMLKAYRREAAVDPENLTDTERARHDRQLEFDGRYITAIANVKARIEPQPYRRQEPQLLKAERKV